MKNFLRATLLLTSLCACMAISAAAQENRETTPISSTDTTIPRGAKIYIAPMGGFETYLAAALRKKEVPVVMVTEPDRADFEITGSSEKKKSGWAKTIFMGDGRASVSSSMQIVNMKTKVIVYADSSDRGSANRGERSTAEKLAKYLKKKIEDDEKKAGKMMKNQ